MVELADTLVSGISELTLMGVQVPLRARARDFEQCAGFVSVSYHTARRKCRTVCPHKELQSAFIPFITSERMRYKSLRTDKRKTRQAFFASRLHRVNPLIRKSVQTGRCGVSPPEGVGAVLKVGYFFDSLSSLKLSLCTVVT